MKTYLYYSLMTYIERKLEEVLDKLLMESEKHDNPSTTQKAESLVISKKNSPKYEV